MNLFGRKSTAAAVKNDVKSDAKTAAAPATSAKPAAVADLPKAAATGPDASGSGTVGPGAAADIEVAETPVVGSDPATPDATPPAPSPAAPSAPSSRLAFLDKGSDTMTAANPPKAPAGILPPGATRLDPSPRRTVDAPAGGTPAGLAALMPGGVHGGRADVATPSAAPATPAPAPVPDEPPQRRLTVGRDILLAGEIASCDVLVVEGTVEAKLRDGHSIEVADTGLFKGSVEIDDADIAGRFEGDLLVRRRLRVRASGKIIGSVVYGELEVEAGGQLVGAVKLYDPNEAPVATTTSTGGGASAPMGFAPQTPPNVQSTNDQQPVFNTQY